MVAQPGKDKKDVCRVDVSPTGRSWKWASDLSFPFNIDDMVDYCVGCIPGASGIFGIDNTQGKPTLTFTGVRATGPGPRAAVSCNLPVVANPKSLVTTLDEDGFTNVLVGGDGILHISSQDCAHSVEVGAITAPPTFADKPLWGTHKLAVAQNGQAVTIWALNGDHNLVGQSAMLKLDNDAGVDELLGVGPTVPLLAGGEDIQTFDAIIHPITGSQQLFCLKKDGSVSCLRQPGDSKLWSEQKLRIPDPDDVEDVNTYACHVKIKTAAGQPLTNIDIQLVASSEVSCVANGWRKILGCSPVAAKTDTQGVLCLVIPAPDLNVPTITISGFGLPPTSFHPAVKVMAKLSRTAESGELANARRPDGSVLFPNTHASTTNAIVGLCKRYTELEQSPSAASKNSANSVHSNINSNSPAVATALVLADAEDHGLLWQLWHGLASGVEEIIGFVYEAGVFIVETAKKAFKFVVEKAEQALSALSGLFKAIGSAIEDAIVWLAEKFDWGGIIDTMTILDELFNAGIDVMQDIVAEGGDAVDSMFEAIEREVGSWHLPPVPPSKMASLKPNSDQAKTSGALSFTESPVFNWVNTHIENGDSKARMSAATAESDVADFTSVLKKMCDEIMTPLWDNFKDTFSSIWEDLKKLFSNDTSVTWVDVFKNIGADILLGIVRGIRKLVHGILAVSGSFISWVQAMMNKPVDIWVVSKLFRKVTNGKELTMMRLSSLIIAVPTTLVFRVLYGKSLRDVPQIVELLALIRSGHERVGTDPSFPMSGLGTAVTAAARREAPAYLETVQSMPVLPSSLRIHSPLLKEATGPTANGAPAKSRLGTAPLPFDADAFLKAFLKRSSISSMTKLLRLGVLIKNAASIAYTCLDCILTGLTWKTLGGRSINEESEGWKKCTGVYFSIVFTIASFPLEKLSRDALGVTLRILTWGGTGIFNYIKAGVPAVGKPVVAGLTGLLDMVMYVIVLKVEGDGDPLLEWSQRVLTNFWAMGSMYNAQTGGTEPWGLGITILVGLALNIEGFALAKRQIAYFDRHSEEEAYDPPAWATSLNGSLL